MHTLSSFFSWISFTILKTELISNTKNFINEINSSSIDKKEHKTEQSVSFDSLGTVSTPVDDMDIFAFYVSALEAPINQLKDYAVWVDVYVGRSGSPYAYVKPDYSFSLNNAKPSNNATANYWHVFNIGRFSNQAIIIPISATEPISVPVSTFYGFYADISSGYNGAIATSLCQVKENMPNTTKCQL